MDDTYPPYVIHINKGSQNLYFLGCKHSYDPLHPQFPRILKLWKQFLEESRDRDKAVMVEGGVRPIKNSQDETITISGEGGLLCFLADKEGVPALSPEPDEKTHRQEWLKVFSRDEIQYTVFADYVSQWNRVIDKPDFRGYIQNFLDQNKEDYGWDDFDFSLDHMISLHDNQNDHPFDPETCRECMAKVSHLNNPVSAEGMTIRDEAIVTKIKELWEEGKNIFVVYGSGHAFTCEPALRKLLV